ncbi:MULTISPECIES: phosphomannomutase/phosphoglucomutase [unclassified Campylobacter]|uniref:phosphomannomutase/phosphoglucomutase n=1 Tax=unclassified Campylobacter TaxID=2593542 RepID=UPI0014740366|nr:MULTISPECIES: phosphomannomutase/phosphoglucomutase [unclassified Campylobacter]
MLEEIFREYDIRGIYERDLNETSVKAIGLNLGREMLKRGAKNVSVGYDARLSAEDIFGWLVSGLNAAGTEVFDIGLLPTPVGYFSVFNDKFDANIMITGSHNPKEYNGFKITIFKDSYFGADLQKLKDEVISTIKAKTQIKDDFRAVKFDIASEYKKFIIDQFAHLKNMKLKIVMDCANGAVGAVLPEICKSLNLDAEILYPNPDGNFPNHHPDPSEEKNLKDIKEALKGEFEIGFGFDGDGDRIAVLTKNRNIKGDELAYLYSLVMKNPRVLGEVKCSQNMYDEIDKNGGKSFMGKTGHSNIKKAMKELNIDMAAEVSGHIFFKERYFGFDDALYAMFRVLELVQKGINLDAELEKLPKVFSTDEIKVETSESKKFKIIEALKLELAKGVKELPEVKEIIDIDGVRVRFEDGWALVRASNTTPVIVTRFEARSEVLLKKLSEIFLNLVENLKSRV